MKFICDAMLGHLGKRLRSAGYDTLIDHGAVEDRVLLKIAQAENRLLLTCDRGLESRPGVIYLASNDENRWASHLRQTLNLSWTHAPFTRCLECNHELVVATGVTYERVPENVRAVGGRGLHCTDCDKVFWDGTHVTRMRSHLEDLNEAL